MRQAKGGGAGRVPTKGTVCTEFLTEEWPVPSVVGRNPHGNACGACSGQCAGAASRR